MSVETTSPQSQDGQTQAPAVDAQNAVEESPSEKAIRMFGEMSDRNESDEAVVIGKEDAQERQSETNSDDKPNDKQKEDGGKKDEEQGKDNNVSKAFAAVAEKEARFQNEKREIKARLQEAERKATETQAVFERIKSNPLAFLSELGLDLDSVLKAAANHEDAPKPKETKSQDDKSEVQRLRDELRAKDQAEAEKQALDQLKGDIGGHITENQDKYPMILDTDDAQGQVFDLIDEYFRQTGKVMPIDEASDMVESELKAMAEKWIGGKYLQSKIASLKVNGGNGKSDGKDKKTQSVSLSNSMTSASALAQLTDEQRTALAIKMFAERSVDPADME